jgi:hypothetical protein
MADFNPVGKLRQFWVSGMVKMAHTVQLENEEAGLWLQETASHFFATSYREIESSPRRLASGESVLGDGSSKC